MTETTLEKKYPEFEGKVQRTFQQALAGSPIFDLMVYMKDVEEILDKHFVRREPCDGDECINCGERDCPHKEPLHYHHDGCPACYDDFLKREKEDV
jgi:hypothetical protein